MVLYIPASDLYYLDGPSFSPLAGRRRRAAPSPRYAAHPWLGGGGGCGMPYQVSPFYRKPHRYESPLAVLTQPEFFMDILEADNDDEWKVSEGKDGAAELTMAVPRDVDPKDVRVRLRGDGALEVSVDWVQEGDGFRSSRSVTKVLPLPEGVTSDQVRPRLDRAAGRLVVAVPRPALEGGKAEEAAEKMEEEQPKAVVAEANQSVKEKESEKSVTEVQVHVEKQPEEETATKTQADSAGDKMETEGNADEAVTNSGVDIVTEKNGPFVARFDVSGYEPAHLSVEVAAGEGAVRVGGVREDPTDEADVTEVRRLSREARVDVGEFDLSAAASAYESGVLTITVPRRKREAAAAGVSVPIKFAE